MKNLNFEDEEHCSETDNPEWPDPWPQTPTPEPNTLPLRDVIKPAEPRSSSVSSTSGQPISKRLRRSRLGPEPDPITKYARPSSQTNTSASPIAATPRIPPKREILRQPSKIKPRNKSVK